MSTRAKPQWGGIPRRSGDLEANRRLPIGLRIIMMPRSRNFSESAMRPIPNNVRALCGAILIGVVALVYGVLELN